MNSVFSRLWVDFQELNPQAKPIHDLLESRGEKITNDHVAFRTFNHPDFNIDRLAEVFVKMGYEKKDHYAFESKKLDAFYYQHSDQTLPKVFISELRLQDFSHDLQDRVHELLKQVDRSILKADELCFLGRPWQVSYADYLELAKESEYAGWLAAFGFRANHFTVSFNSLKTFGSLAELNEFLKSKGFALNQSGGEIKGRPEDLLEQSSTLAARIPWKFTEATAEIPSCYYEFARRYPDAKGQLYQGFIAASADRIFESTDRQVS